MIEIGARRCFPTMLAAGDPVPEFRGTTASGTPISTETLTGHPTVLYFYPKAGSYGCTRESVEFARYFEEFHARGVEIVGVSIDSTEEQKRFAESCSLPFPLLADPGGDVARKFGVLGAFGFARRVTFLILPNGRIGDVVVSPLPGPHIRRAREFFSPTASPAPSV